MNTCTTNETYIKMNLINFLHSSLYCRMDTLLKQQKKNNLKCKKVFKKKIIKGSGYSWLIY